MGRIEPESKVRHRFSRRVAAADGPGARAVRLGAAVTLLGPVLGSVQEPQSSVY